MRWLALFIVLAALLLSPIVRHYLYESIIILEIVCVNQLLHPQLDKLLSCKDIRMTTPSDQCIFCDIIKNNGPNKIIYSDEEFVAFEDINPAAKSHYLLIPRSHIGSVKQLGPNHIPMLHNMTRIAKQITSNNVVLGFHVPPFNSIDHLHLHILEKPFKNVFRSLKYPTSWVCNWFVPLDKLIASLGRGKQKYHNNFTWDWDI